MKLTCWSHPDSSLSQSARMPKGKSDKDERSDRVDRVEKTEKGDREECKCGSCLKEVGEQDNGVLCEICETWYHCRCQAVSDPMYKALSQYGADLHWFCKGCRYGAEKLFSTMAKMQTKMDKLEDELVRIRNDIKGDMALASKEWTEEFNGLSKRIARCEKKMDESSRELQTTVEAKLADIEKQMADNGDTKWSDVVGKEVENKLSGMTSEMETLHQQTKAMLETNEELENINRRKNCVIVHGMKEPVGDSFESRKKEDTDQIIGLLHEIDCDDVSINNIFRLGKRQEDPVSKPRSIKLVVSSEGQKEKILKRAKNLRSKGFDKIFIHQDLTPRQQERRKLLVQEMKERMAKGETDLIIIQEKIVKRRAHQE